MYIISTPPETDLPQFYEKPPNFERDFLYQPIENRRTPLPTTQSQKIPNLYFHINLSKIYRTLRNNNQTNSYKFINN